MLRATPLILSAQLCSGTWRGSAISCLGTTVPSSGLWLVQEIYYVAQPKVLVSLGLLPGDVFSSLFVLKGLSPYLLGFWG